MRHPAAAPGVKARCSRRYWKRSPSRRSARRRSPCSLRRSFERGRMRRRRRCSIASRGTTARSGSVRRCSAEPRSARRRAAGRRWSRASGDCAAGEQHRTGARGGPGGSPAFPRAQTRGGRGRGRGAGVPALKLTREPALVAVAQDPGDIGRRAAALLPQLDWPGKPGAAAATPLTPEEQQRFETGREVYQTLCAACHQPDGRGREHLAPSLTDPSWRSGRAASPFASC